MKCYSDLVKIVIFGISTWHVDSEYGLFSVNMKIRYTLYIYYEMYGLLINDELNNRNSNNIHKKKNSVLIHNVSIIVTLVVLSN